MRCETSWSEEKDRRDREQTIGRCLKQQGGRHKQSSKQQQAWAGRSMSIAPAAPSVWPRRSRRGKAVASTARTARPSLRSLRSGRHKLGRTVGSQ
eukprot:5619623-Pleurochrysis_carterae.AAC.2